MLRFNKVIICLMVVVILIFGMNIVNAKSDDILIAFVPKVLVGDPFQVVIAEAVIARGKELGVEVIVQAASSHGRADEQISIVENLIARRVDGIILNPLDANAIVPAIKKANEAGIPIVTLDSAAAAGHVITHIATHNEKGAYIAGEALIEALKAKGLTKAKVAIIEGEPGGETAIARRKGFHDRINEEPGFEIVASLTGHWTTPGAVKVMEDLLQSHPDLDGVFTSSDMMGVGAAQVIKRSGKDITLVTFDGIPEGLDLVQKGIAYADVAQFPKRMGIFAIDVIVAIVRGVDPVVFKEYIDSGVEVVTADKVEQFMKENWGE